MASEKEKEKDYFYPSSLEFEKITFCDIKQKLRRRMGQIHIEGFGNSLKDSEGKAYSIAPHHDADYYLCFIRKKRPKTKKKQKKNNNSQCQNPKDLIAFCALYGQSPDKHFDNEQPKQTEHKLKLGDLGKDAYKEFDEEQKRRTRVESDISDGTLLDSNSDDDINTSEDEENKDDDEDFNPYLYNMVIDKKLKDKMAKKGREDIKKAAYYLLNYVKDDLFMEGYKFINLNVREDNDHALKFYTKNGFDLLKEFYEHEDITADGNKKVKFHCLTYQL